MAGEVKLKLSIDGNQVVSAGLDRVGLDLDKMKQSAAQTSAALRGVPAQFTDIVTSLQAGQSPLSVFLQQGGQLKDMFGGAGNAARALGGYVLGLVNPFSVGAAAVLGLAVAYEQGAGESRAMEKSLILSGNQAGVTTGQMMAMAASIDQVVGTQGNAAAALAVMATGSKVGGESLERFTTTAIRFERVTGTAVEDTAAKFAELRKAPLEATLKLNESMGYLTQATYNQIKALTDEGRAVEAATVAQEAFDKATADMATQLEANLGLVERSWKKVTGAVKEAWDSIKGIGRDSGLEGQVAAARQMVEVRRQAASSIYATASDRTKLNDAENQLKGYEELLKNQQLSAKYAAERSEQVRQGAEWDKQGAKFLAEQVKLERDIATAGQLGLAAGKRETEIAQRELDIRKSYEKSTASKGLSDSAKGLILYNDLIAKASGLNADFAEKWDSLGAAYKAGRISLDALTEAQRELLKEQSFAKELVKEQTALVKERLQTAEVERVARIKAADAAEQTTAKLNESNQALRDEIELMGLSEVQQVALLQQRNEAIILTKEATLAELQRQSAVTGTQTRVEIALEAEIAALRERNALLGQKSDRSEAVETAKAVFAEWKRGWEETDRLARDVFVTWTEGGANAAQKIGDTLKRALASAIYEATLKPIALRVYAALTGSLVGGSALAGQGGGQAGGLGDIYGSVSTGSMLGGLKGWLTDFGGGVASQVSKLGNYLSGFSNSTVAGWGEGLMNNASAIGKYAEVAGNTLGYLNAAIAASEGKWGKAIGGAVGTAFFGPLGGAVGGALGGWVDDAFGGGREYTTGQGITGTFSGAAFAGRNYQKWKNDGSSGLFGIGGSGGSSGTNYSAMDAAQVGAFSKSFAALKVAAIGYASAIGASASSIDNYSKTISVALGSDAEANAKAISKVFQDIADELAAKVVDSRYVKEGETASATLARLATSLTTVNGWLGVMGQKLLAVSQAGGDAASKLVDAFGGVDKLAASAQEFYTTYYTDAEQVAGSQEAMTKALAKYGMVLPQNKKALRDLAATLDLNSESGRAAYAVLLQIAPKYAEIAAKADQLASDTAASLIKTYTAGGRLSPTLASLGSTLLAVQGNAQGASSSASVVASGMASVHAVMLDASSPVVSFGTKVAGLSAGLTDAQKTSAALQAQIGVLSGAATKGTVDFAGLAAALKSVDTTTLVTTITSAFERIAERVRDVIESITAERVAVREAAIRIVDPTVMSKQAIAAGVRSVNTALPNNSALVGANTTLAAANTAQAQAQAGLTVANSNLSAAQAHLDNTKNQLTQDVKTYRDTAAAMYKLTEGKYYWVNSSSAGGQNQYANTAFQYDEKTNRFSDYKQNTYSGGVGWRNMEATEPERMKLANTLWGANARLARDEAEITRAKARVEATASVIPAAQGAVAKANERQAAAAAAAAKSLLEYQRALQNFSVDASKSVNRLSRLREETVRYYEAQRDLATLMGTSATNLRKTVGDYRYSQMSAGDQLATLQAQFSSAYALAQSTQGDGATLAGYADKLNALLSPLIDKLGETGKSNLVASYLAQAEAIATLVQDKAPKDYQAESLGLLSDIDATLAALDASTRSAEGIIAAAVNAGSDRTAAGLSAVIKALQGQPVPAFATGGAFTNGVVSRPTVFNAGLMGEAGPEGILPLANVGGRLGVHANLNRGGGSGSARLEALIERQNQLIEQQTRELENLRSEARATATNTGKTTNILRRVTQDGDTLKTEEVA